jgi:NAD(P)-dependent dehydrogenase (short-subunit alcohol dehydrogenase family)
VASQIVLVTGGGRGIGVGTPSASTTAAMSMRRGGLPEEVAEAILWLLSSQAAYSTGTFIDVAGGR